MKAALSHYWIEFISFLRRHWLILSIIAVASLLRFVDLGSTPPGVWVDEFGPSYDAWIIVTGKGASSLILSPPQNLTYFITNSLQGLFISQYVFGPSTFAIRFPSALMGVGLVAATYLLTNLIFGRRVALASTLLLAISPWAIQGSRVFYMGISVDSLFFLTLGTYLVLATIRESRPGIAKLLLGSILIGFSAGYFFTDYGRLTATIVFALLLCLSQIALRRAYPRLRIHGAVMAELGIVGFLFLIIPILSTGSTSISAANPGGISFYIGTNNLLLQGHVDSYRIFAERYLNYFTPGYLFINGDINRIQNTGMTGELLFTSLPFFYVGLAYLIYRICRKGTISRWVAFMLVAWLLSAPVEAAAFVPTNYTDSSGSIFMMPVLQIATAQGFVLTYDWVHERLFSPLLVRTRTNSPMRKLHRGIHRPHLSQQHPGMHLGDKAVTTCIVLSILSAPALAAFVQAYWVENPAALLNDPNLDNWNFMWGDFYGFDSVAAYITSHGLTDLPVYVSPAGFFGNNLSDFYYYHYVYGYPEAYIYYYSRGVVDYFPGLANPPYFFSPTPALIVSGSPETLTTLRSEGLIANSLFSVFRPNGAIAISLTEVFPGLNSTAENQTLDYGASVVGITSLTSESMSFLTSINQSFTIFMRFSIPWQLYKPNTYYNLFYIDQPTPTVGWRMASQSYQPGGGPTNLMTLSAYLYSLNHNFSKPGTVSLLWYYNTLDPNVTYDAALVFSSGMVSLYINDTFVGGGTALDYPLQPMSSPVTFDSGVNATIDDFYVWNSALSASQIGYFSCHSGFVVCG